MRSFTLRVLGFPVLSVDVEDFSYVAEEDEEHLVGGGSGHNFTIATPWIDERYLPWEEEGKTFGFGGEL